MAACLISVTGSSGLVRLDYMIDGYWHNIETGVGELYIEDSAINVTYTTLSGDLIASSLCLTITELPLECYTLSWSGINVSEDYIITDLIFESLSISMPDISFPNSGTKLQDYINNLNNSAIKIIGRKTKDLFVIDVPGCTNCFSKNVKKSYIFKILGLGKPTLRIKNKTTDDYIFIEGILSSCTIPEGYTEINPCYTNTHTTTTTTVL